MSNENKKVFFIANDETKEQYGDFVKQLKAKYDVDFSVKNISHNSKVECIIVIGGDGTLNYLLNNTASLRNYNILYFPCGTANDFARSLNIKDVYPTVLLVENIMNNAAIVDIPVMKCNEKKFINVASAGAPAKITNSGSDLLKEYSGKVSYYVSALEQLTSLKQQSYKVTWNDQVKEISTYGFVISQGLYAGGGVKVSTSFTPLFQDEFQFTSNLEESMASCIKSIIELQGIYRKKKDDPVLSFNTDQIIITSDKPISLKLDGEEYQSSKIEFNKMSDKVSFYLY